MPRIYMALGLLLLTAPLAFAAPIGEPVLTDARIKTLVYNENDVYPITTVFGYQSNVEFGLKEEIETISLGDRIGWQIIPSGRRLFIRAMAENIRTNMTVVTSRRAYQFDLRALTPSQARGEQLTYVARFFYPDDEPKPRRDDVPAAVTAEQVSQTGIASAYNYNYSYSGPEDIAPLKIFDDGNSTYFKLRDVQAAPMVSAVKPDRTETTLPARFADGYLVVPGVMSRLSLRQGSSVLCVFNEANPR